MISLLVCFYTLGEIFKNVNLTIFSPFNIAYELLKMDVSPHTVLRPGVKVNEKYYPGSILSVYSNQNVQSKTKNVESKIAFGQLILRKIIKTVATRCQILRLKYTKIQNSAGAPPQTTHGELTALPRSPGWI